LRILITFTYGISLDIWSQTGILSREISIYKRLKKSDINFTFLTYGNDKDLKYQKKINGIKVLPIKNLIKANNRVIPSLKSFLLPIKLRKTFKEINIIKTNQIKGSWVAWLAKLLFGTRLIVRGGYEWFKFYMLNCHYSNNANSLKYWIKYFLIYIISLISYKLADKIILTNQDDIKFIVNTFRLNKKREKIYHIYNYIDTALFKPLKIEKKDKHILFIGKSTRQKNLFNLIEAFKDLENFTLDIIGIDKNNDIILKKAKSLNINLNLLGKFPNNKLPEVLNQYEIFILPSYYEGNPKVLLEAMSCGIACIGSDVWGIKNIIRHKENGFLCKTDSRSIKNAIIALYSDDRLREKIGINGRKFILNNCSLHTIAKKENLLYQNMVISQDLPQNT